MKTELSKILYNKAIRLIPGGVNSPVRAFKAVESNPLFISHGSGAYIYDIDKNSYIDYVGSWGPLILGHCHKSVVKGINKALNKGTSFGAPSPLELTLAELIIDAFPSIEMVRMVSSGTEATMSAIRLARAYTKRDRVVKFEGCYHGHSDGLLVKAGSGAATFGVPDSPGVPEGYSKNTIVAAYNDLKGVENIFKKEGKKIACLIIEPIVGNSGVLLPEKGFLEGLRDITNKYDSLLIFDEVMTGFRIGLGGAQALYKIKPDLTTLGKIIGGGLPVGAYGGRKDIMSLISPSGPVYQAGTLSGNPAAMAAGIATVKVLTNEKPYNELSKITAYIADEIVKRGRKEKIALTCNKIGSMFTIFFRDGEVKNFQDAAKSDRKKFSLFFKGMLEAGIYLPPSQFEAAFLSTAHTVKEADKTIAAAEKIFKKIK